MDKVITILQLVSSLPVAISLILSIGAVLIVGYARFKQVDITNKTSTSSIQDQQITTLMNQIKLLSDELTQARQQLTEIHNQNIKLMEQLRNANQRIGELEIAIAESKSQE